MAKAKDRLRLHRVRRPEQQVAGPMPPLRRLEHAGRNDRGAPPAIALSGASPAAAGEVRALSSGRGPERSALRRPGIEEFDRVLGGGLVPGGVDPAGWRSRHRQVDAAAAGDGRRSAWRARPCTSPARSRRADRVARAAPGAGQRRRSSCWPRCSSRRSSARFARGSPDVVVIDSIQTVYTEALESAPGSVAQVRECAAQLTRLAKQSGDHRASWSGT